MLTTQEKLIYSSLGTHTKRAIGRFRGSFGRPYNYRPRITLCKRIAQQQNMSVEDAQDTLLSIRAKIKQSNGEAIL